MSKRLSKENFIERANKIHSNKYDYGKTEYLNNKTKVCIICPEHGEFWRTPYMHLGGSICPKCSREDSGLLKRLTTTRVRNLQLTGSTPT